MKTKFFRWNYKKSRGLEQGELLWGRNISNRLVGEKKRWEKCVKNSSPQFQNLQNVRRFAVFEPLI